MATFWRHECDSCGYSFETSGLHEFYVDADGRLQDYGHPLAKSREAKEAGISGFYAHARCLNRDENVDVVVREFEHPVGRHDGIWTRGALPEKQVDVRCPLCGDDAPVMGDVPLGPSVICPKCGGILMCEVSAMS